MNSLLKGPPRRLAAGLALLICLAASAAVARRALTPRIVPGPLPDGVVRLHSGWNLSPAGRHVTTANMLIGSAMSPDGKMLAIVSAGFGAHVLYLVDTATGAIRFRVPLRQAWNGVAWAPDGKTVYVSGGQSQSIHLVRQGADDRWAATNYLVLDGLPPGEPFYGAGLALSRKADTLFVANCAGDSIYALRLPDGAIVARTALPAGARPYCVRRGGDGLVYVAEWGLSRVGVFDPLTLAPIRTLDTGPHPNDLALSRDSRRLFVSCANADAVDIFDLPSGTLTDRVRTTETPRAPAGASPCALALFRNDEYLLAADADANDIAVLDIRRHGRAYVRGFIPAGYYPTAVAVSNDNQRIFIGSSKGWGSGPNPSAPVGASIDRQPRFLHVNQMLRGMISMLPIPNLQRLAAYSRQVSANSPYTDDTMPAHPPTAPPPGANPIPSHVGDPSPIKHVLYILKENRTYDQVLGDMPEGNGDPNLTLFGENTTPNHHAIARQFALLDNLYCNGDVSADGHAWSDGALATDYTQRAWTTGYSGHGAPPATPSLITPPAGFIWDACRRKGLDFRSYGEYAYTDEHRIVSIPLEAPDGLTGLRGHTCRAWLAATRKRYRDTEKADIFISEFRDYERTGDLPAFMVMSLGEDHTRGTVPGNIAPGACVAGNDAALGRILETVSRSKFWRQMAVFVIEDDAQNGPDHVDAHRTVALVASPYVRRHSVDSTFYTTASVLRTMELILGLPPMSQYDAAAAPMYASFGWRPDFSPYTSVAPRVDLNRRNVPGVYGAARTAKIDFSDYDRLTVSDEDALNKALWYSIKGANIPYPGTHSLSGLSVHRPAATGRDD
jgi:DNA-binding beta-propeller fold protein YncE